MTGSASSRLALSLCLGAALASAAPGLAQPAAPAPDSAALNAALRTLAQNPNSLEAVLGAGTAALKVDDADAALGFFRRAAALNPQDGRVKAGLASAMARLNQPLEALRLFTEAEQRGALSPANVSDRGLAYDLIGDTARAQRDYATALATGPDPVVVRRLALSQAIAGDSRGADATLLPLLQHQDLAAYRTRAFALAIGGRGDEAVSIAETMLPATLSNRMAPYLRYMPRLTRAQQAAAADLGAFPRAGDIGRDAPEVAAYAGTLGLAAAQPAQSADARLVPSGAPLGASGARSGAPARPTVAAATPAPAPARRVPVPVPAAAAAAPAATPPPAPTIPPVVVRASPARPAPAPAAADAVPERARAMMLQHPELVRATPARTPPPAAALLPPAAAAPPPATAAVVAPPPAPPPALASVPPAAPPAVGPPVAAPVVARDEPPRALAPAAAPPPAALPATPPPAVSAGPAPIAPSPPPATPVAPPVVVASLPETPPPGPVTVAVAPSTPAAPDAAPAPAPVAQSAPAPRPSLSDAFGDLRSGPAVPAAAPGAGAVDITKIQPRRPAPPPKPAAPKPPPAPSREWVQVATGRSTGGLAFDWRRLKKEAGGVLDKATPSTAEWGRTKRLVIGPFASGSTADKMVAKLKDKGIDAFRFTSDEGQDVAPLD